jgi:integrase
VPLPPRGERERVLTRGERVGLLRGAEMAFRRFMLAMICTMARPQEVRALRWDQLRGDGTAFVLDQFKGKGRRRDGVRVRVLPVNARLARLLARLARRPAHLSSDRVFLNGDGRPWTANAVRCRMRRLRARLGLDQGAEPVVCYTLRHTAATDATANGVTDRVLAELMGHASTRTTARYQHLQIGHLTAAIEQATRRRVG